MAKIPVVSSFTPFTHPGGTISTHCGSSNYAAFTDAPPADIDSVVDFNEESVYSWKNDPSKGRPFNRRRIGNAILMSHYSVGSVRSTEFVLQERHTRERWRIFNRSCSSPPLCNYSPPFTGVSITTRNRVPSNVFVRNDDICKRVGSWYVRDEAAIREAMISTQQSCWSEAINGYDLLTELGEMEESISYIFGKQKGVADFLEKGLLREGDPSLFRKFRRYNAKRLMKDADRAVRKLGSRWMEYRYALMPIIYSYRDIADTWDKRHSKYHTTRSQEYIPISVEPDEYEGDEYLVFSSSGSIQVRSTSKALYDLGSLQRLTSLIGFNPFRTAWELIPMSFVIDWFINVGDSISALTGLDYSSHRVSCTSVKHSQVDVASYHRNSRENTGNGIWQSPCGPVTVHPGGTFSSYVCNGEIFRRITERYDRTLWTRPEPALQFNPRLHWRRFIDGAVLGYQPTSKKLRSLK